MEGFDTMNDALKSIWPETLLIRDTKIYDDLGGGGKRIYTTTGNGYERKEYTRSDIAQSRIETLEAADEIESLRELVKQQSKFIDSAFEVYPNLDLDVEQVIAAKDAKV
jgi:hypothetical protein